MITKNSVLWGTLSDRDFSTHVSSNGKGLPSVGNQVYERKDCILQIETTTKQVWAADCGLACLNCGSDMQ